ncbi:DnaA regulatory inactivator Hda [Fontimonas sp. SYSU GA230001]|uniref:DnaA regulatory inactivator Hda n=1 Tax=Fontimonas sp. SYSU GA230001 TaxID=3142450 RepID=UPI0032B3B950
MKGAQLPLAVQLRDTANFDSYLAGPNAEAVQALRELRQPVLLYGPPGCGRTHLLQAACRQHGGSYLSLADAAELGPGILDGYVRAPGVFLDDLDAVVDSRAWCIALLRLLDTLRTDDRRFALSAAAGPERLDVVLGDLRTRLSQCLVLGLRPLDDAQRAQLLRLRARMRGLDLPDEVIRWLLNTRSRDVNSLLEALELLDRGSLSARRRITLPLAQALLVSADGRREPG